MSVARHFSQGLRAKFSKPSASSATSVRHVLLSSSIYPRHSFLVSSNYAQLFSTSPKTSNKDDNPMNIKAAFSGINIPSSKSTENSPMPSLDKIWEARSRDILDEVARSPIAHKYSGRTVKVYSGQLSEGFQKLQGIIQRNKVFQMSRSQKRHEQKGEKRRRLTRERWRNRFADEVRKRVELVSEIRRRRA